ncbi:hypothetical protein C2G38_2159952 [Gigaspora rosea]|uniref:TLDc domain-containing protein n=1 Tax=Gigaspora rosea TaxID=44941 RepID=A0A397W252_9GLOM|nr:hypothetical protein C2G38_2159952 [Gigaspora rosea]
MSSKFFEQLSQDRTQLLESEYDYNVVIKVGEQPNIQLFKGHSAILYQLSLENFEVSAKFDLLIAANELENTELVKHLQSQLINDNASWLYLNFSRVYQLSFLTERFEPLQQFCNNILTKHPSLIFNSDDFTTLQESALISLLKIDNLQMEESEIWDKNFKSLKSTVQHCLPHIRYFQITGKDVLKKIKPYRYILEENIWNDIIARFVDPEAPVTSLILPPRKKETVQLPSRKASIITPGSRDRFSGKDFHKLCDNIPGTVVIVKINSTDEILGGYNPLVWKIGHGYVTMADSFIFSLKNGSKNQSILSRVINPSRAILYHTGSCGPYFSSDLAMIGSKEWNCNQHSYDKCIKSANGMFSIDEFEVFQICKNT